MESDPHVLVALAAAAIERVVPAVSSPTVHRTVDDRNVSHHSPPVFVTLPGEEIGTTVQEHTSPTGYRIVNDHDVNCVVLDAIASMSVSNVGQVVAVTLEMDISKQVAVLTVANSWGADPDLVAYLSGLWHLMRSMSTLCEKARQEIDPTACIRTQLPIQRSNAVGPWRTEFIKRIYRYCRPTIIELFRDQWKPLERFIHLFQGRQYGLPGGKVVKGQLNDTFNSLEAMYSSVHRFDLMTDKDWGELICVMDGAVLDIERILDDPTLCEKWAAELQSPYDQLFPLRLALKRLIFPHRQIQILLRFSQSPQSRPTLLCKMTVRAIPRLPSVQIALPTTPLRWQSLIEYVCGDNLIASYSWLDQQVTKLISNSQYRNNPSGNFHGICAIIAYLEASPRISQPPFSYIASSTLTCSACHTWIQAFNALGGRQYRTRGTDGNWCFPWAMPNLASATDSQKAAVTTHMAGLVAAECVKFWTAQGHVFA